MRPRLTAILAALALFAASMPLVAAPPRALAAPSPDDGFYLDTLNGLPVYNRFSRQTLLQEGHKICDDMQHGASEDSATETVRSDLGTSTYDSYRLVSAAELGLACFSLKVHGQI